MCTVPKTIKTSYNNVKIEVILIAPAGSRLYGNERDDSDYDYRGVFIVDNDIKLGIKPVLETISSPEFFAKLSDEFNLGLVDTSDCVLYELSKYAKLALDNNPNILDILCVPESSMIYINYKGLKLINAKKFFISKKTKHTLSGYAVSQLKKLDSHKNNIKGYPDTSKVLEYLNLLNGDYVDSTWITDYFGSDVAKNMKEVTNLECKMSIETVCENLEKIYNVDNPKKYVLPRLIDYIKFYDINYKRLSSKSLNEFVNNSATFRKLNENTLLIYERGNGIFSKEGNIKSNPERCIGEFVCLATVDNYNYKKDRENLLKMYKHKINRNDKRSVLEDKYLYDTKHASHLVRLMEKAKSILINNDYNPVLSKEELDKVNKVKNGVYSYDEVVDYANSSDLELNILYETSTLRSKPDFNKVNELIIELQKGE